MAVTVKRIGYVPAVVNSGGTSLASRYLRSVTPGDWALNGADYVLTINATTHGKGTNPIVTAYMDNGVTFEEVGVSVTFDNTGNVSIFVSSTPDNRFSGKILVV